MINALFVVYTGDVRVGSAPFVLKAIGVGSCVVVCLYDKERKVGGLAHVMLPTSKVDKAEKESTYTAARYAEDGIDNMIESIKELRSDIEDLEASVVGGAEMFPNINTDISKSLGTQNFIAVRKKLEAIGIPIVLKDVGGNVGRSVRFDLETGIVEVKKRIS